MLAVELVCSDNPLPDVDFGGELSTEKRFVKSVTLYFLIVLGNNLRQNIVVVFERLDGFDNLVIVFHYTHSECFLLFNIEDELQHIFKVLLGKVLQPLAVLSQTLIKSAIKAL
jgi:hypothetical protein